MRSICYELTTVVVVWRRPLCKCYFISTPFICCTSLAVKWQIRAQVQVFSSSIQMYMLHSKMTIDWTIGYYQFTCTAYPRINTSHSNSDPSLRELIWSLCAACCVAQSTCSRTGLLTVVYGVTNYWRQPTR